MSYGVVEAHLPLLLVMNLCVHETLNLGFLQQLLLRKLLDHAVLHLNDLVHPRLDALILFHVDETSEVQLLFLCIVGRSAAAMRLYG